MAEDRPDDIRKTVERLTHLARNADGAEADAYRERRDALLADHGYVARVRSEPTRDVLVCYPDEWVGGGVVQIDDIESLDRAIEIPLSGPGDPDDWNAVDEANRELAAQIRERYGDVHGDTADAFADFMSNHYAKRIASATPAERREFREEYFVRNAWPSDAQKAAIERTLELLGDVELPE